MQARPAEPNRRPRYQRPREAGRTGKGPSLGGVGGDGPPPSAHRGLQGQERTAVRIAQWD